MARILVIDDYQPILALLQLMLTSAGHEVVTAENGETGLGLAKRVQPDLVLLDVDMPAMDGLAVCGQLKSDVATMRIPVLLMTGRPCVQRIEKARHAGALGVLSKPFVRSLLLKEIARAVAV